MLTVLERQQPSKVVTSIYPRWKICDGCNADTFRAGAIEQLQVWADRVGADFISSEPGADPASVMYNALDAAKARDIDVLLCDTAGRLQAHGALMAELGKVMKVMKKKMPEAPHECLLVLDSTIGPKRFVTSERVYRGNTVNWRCAH